MRERKNERARPIQNHKWQMREKKERGSSRRRVTESQDVGAIKRQQGVKGSKNLAAAQMSEDKPVDKPGPTGEKRKKIEHSDDTGQKPIADVCIYKTVI